MLTFHQITSTFIGVDSGGQGMYYKGYFDCIIKIYQSEGITAFYKGIGPMYFRLGPHSVLCLMFWDLFREIRKTLHPPQT